MSSGSIQFPEFSVHFCSFSIAADDSSSNQVQESILSQPVSGIRKLHDHPHFVFYRVPPGKPDPEAPCTVETLRNDLRHRVNQSETKQDNAFYYACNMLRHRIGKDPSPELKSARRIEELCSKRRKFLSNYDPTEMQEFNNQISGGRPVVTKEQARFLLHPAVQRAYFHKRGYPESVQKHQIEIIKEFLESDSSYFSEYLSSFITDKRYEEEEHFLKMFKSSQEELYSLMRNIDSHNWYQQRTWDLLSFEERLQLLSRFCELVVANLYGFANGSWDPNMVFENFMKELREYGPMIVNGAFGSGCYKEDPFSQPHQVLKQRVWGWHKDTRNDSSKRHSILVVGAEVIKGNEYVYYLDPNDASKPDLPRKLYMISYSSLKENALSHFSDKKNYCRFSRRLCLASQSSKELIGRICLENGKIFATL